MNKTFLTVSQVFVAISGAFILLYGAIIFGVLYTETEFMPLNIIGVIFLLFGALYVVIFIRLGQAKSNPEMKTEVIVWSILLLVTSNLIPGIFGLVAATSNGSSVGQGSEDSLEKRLKDLDNLFDKGIITLDEYHERRKRIIEGF